MDLDAPALPSLALLIEEFASTPVIDAFGGVHAPGNDYADVEVAAMNCVVATQDFHDFLLTHEVMSAYVSSDSPAHVANLVDDQVIDWTLRQFDPTAQVPTVLPLAAYRARFPTLSVLPESHANVYSKDEIWPHWWDTARCQAFTQLHLAPSLPHPWHVQSIAPSRIKAIESEWLALHPGYNITRGGAQAAMGQALATAQDGHASLLALRDGTGSLATVRNTQGSLLPGRDGTGSLSGLLAYLQPHQYPNDHDSLHLAWMGVEQGFQHQGAGTALLVALAEAAFRASLPITTSPASKESKAFFVAHGFRYLGWGSTHGHSERHYILPFQAVRALVERTRQMA
jgi:GNAT superfamily N-acetyltransferase